MKRERLIEERHKKKKSREEVAAEMNISTVYVRMIECGSRTPGRDTMIKFSKYYGRGLKILFPDVFEQNDKLFIEID